MEVWKDIPEYEGIYQVSNLGNVKNSTSNRILKPQLNRGGYLHVHLWKNKTFNNERVHRLVAKTFLIKIIGKNDINHKNGIKTDNRVENLEWCTRSENLKHRYRILGYKGSSFGKFGKDNPKSKCVLCIENNITYTSIKEAGEQTSIDRRNISSVCKGKRQTAGGYHWKYI